MKTLASMPFAALVALALSACGAEEDSSDEGFVGALSSLVSVSDPAPGVSPTAAPVSVEITTASPAVAPAQVVSANVATNAPTDSTPDPIPASIRRCGSLPDALSRYRCLSGK